MAVSTVKALINGIETTLAFNSSTGKYQATIQAPTISSYNQAGHFYNVQISATDTAGNTTVVDSTSATVGSSLKLKVKETVVPVLTIVSPTSGAALTNNVPNIIWTVTDNDSGVAETSVTLTLDDTVITTGFTKETIANGFRYTYVPQSALSDGSHTIKVDAKDNDGNVGTQNIATFKIDTIPPVLNVATPTDNLVTNSITINVSGTTNDVTSSPVSVSIKVNDSEVQSAIVQTDGSFSLDVSIVEGTNTLLITATDGANKSSSVTRTVILDTTAPIISQVTLTPNPVDAGATYIISVLVTE